MEKVVCSEVMYMYTDFSIIGLLISMLPLFLIILALRWVRFIYQNSEKQVEQNEKIIELLTEIKEKDK
ncbi:MULTISPECIES: hypothetical protein [Bacillus cereus group]|uniref:hypothetical protein n=3 Tax=Bacillaceae TaxID=186817 RepID=UPI0019687461|nr:MULTISPECIES: hypothetical protein [Bacillus cereus group]